MNNTVMASSSPHSLKAPEANPHARTQFVVKSWRRDLVREFYFPAKLSQAKLDGRNGSSACTVIATRVVKAVLDGSLPLPASTEEPSQVCIEQFVSAMRQGNGRYDSHPRCHGYLSLYQVVQFWTEDLEIIKEHCFLSKGHCKNNLKRIIDQDIGADDVAAGVMVKSPYSVCIIISAGSLVLFDSHPHYLLHDGNRGALISVSAHCADSCDMAECISEFFFITVSLRLSKLQTLLWYNCGRSKAWSGDHVHRKLLVHGLRF